MSDKRTRVPVEIVSDAHLLTGHIKVDGTEIHRVTALSLKAACGEGAVLTLDVLAHDGFQVTLPAEVVVNIGVLEPGIVEVIEARDVGKRYVFKRVEAAR